MCMYDEKVGRYFAIPILIVMRTHFLFSFNFKIHDSHTNNSHLHVPVCNFDKQTSAELQMSLDTRKLYTDRENVED